MLCVERARVDYILLYCAMIGPAYFVDASAIHRHAVNQVWKLDRQRSPQWRRRWTARRMLRCSQVASAHSEPTPRRGSSSCRRHGSTRVVPCQCKRASAFGGDMHVALALSGYRKDMGATTRPGRFRRACFPLEHRISFHSGSLRKHDGDGAAVGR